MFWIGLIIAVLTVPVIVGFVYGWDVDYGITISIFSALSVSHFILQVIFAALDRYRASNYPRVTTTTKKIGVQVTGWKEDPKLFETCLRSIANQTQQPDVVSFCSDGNERDDNYLVRLFQKVFYNSTVIRLANPIQPGGEVDTARLRGVTRVCMTQPHLGKRHAMYTQTRTLLAMGMDYILFVDSDTILRHDGIESLLSCIEATESDAVTGDVRIYNLDNLLSFLVALKYWFAFSIERAAQSYFGNVSCISGPFGFYRSSSIAPLLDEWKQQRFWGKECTFGDDRHLTNLILKYGGTAYYDWRGVCFTDTPVTLRRFITQQTRWGKSFIREYFLNFTWFHRKQLWLLYDLTFMTVYNLLLTAYIVYLFSSFNYTANILFLNAVMGATLLRAIYAVIVSRDAKYLVFSLYTYVYVFILIPVKIWAFLTINVTSWGTGSRLSKTSKYVDLYVVYAWSLFLLAMFTTSLVYAIQDGFSVLDTAMTTTLVGVTLVAYAYYLSIRPRLNDELCQVLDYNKA